MTALKGPIYGRMVGGGAEGTGVKKGRVAEVFCPCVAMDLREGGAEYRGAE